MSTFTIGPDGFARDRAGRMPTRFVDSFTIAELAFPHASVIGLHLYEVAAPIPSDRQAPIQLRLTPRFARSLADALHDLADQLDGLHDARQ